MQDKLSKIIKQINQLFALANSSPYPEECALAIEKARVLMLKYQISEEQLNSKTQEEIIEIDFNVIKSAMNYTIQIAHYLSKAFNCKSIMVKRNVGLEQIKFENSLRFIGSKSDIAVCTYVYCCVCSILDVKVTEYCKDHKGKRIKHDFSLGFIEAVCLKLSQIYEENNKKEFNSSELEQINALVVIKNDLIVKYMNEKYGTDNFESGGQKVEFNPNAYTDGWNEGEKVNINRGIDNNYKSKKEIQ